MNMNVDNDSLFPKRHEYIGLGLTCVGLILTFIEMALGHSILRDSWGIAVRVIWGLLTLQGLHVILTYVALLYVPDLRRWIDVRSRGRPKVFWGAVIGMISVLIATLFFASGPEYHSTSAPKALIYLILLPLAALTFHHRVSQAYGIMIAYDRWQMREGVKPRSTRLAKAERWSVGVLTVGSTAVFAFHFPFFRTGLLEFGIRLEASSWRLLDQTSLVISIAAFAILMFVNWLEFRRRSDLSSRYRLRHSLRFLFVPLSSYSIVATLAMEGLHGVEYIAVWARMNRNLKQGMRELKSYWAPAFAIIVLFYLVSYISFLRVPDPQTGFYQVLRFATATHMSITLVHFFLDRQLFRMRDENSRNIIGVLLGPSRQI